MSTKRTPVKVLRQKHAELNREFVRILEAAGAVKVKDDAHMIVFVLDTTLPGKMEFTAFRRGETDLDPGDLFSVFVKAHHDGTDSYKATVAALVDRLGAFIVGVDRVNPTNGKWNIHVLSVEAAVAELESRVRTLTSTEA